MVSCWSRFCSSFYLSHTDPRSTILQRVKVDCVLTCDERNDYITTIIDLRNELERNKFERKELESNECCICMERRRSHVFSNCMHLCVCEHCKDKMNGICPLCNSFANSTLKVFF